jgi:hypothetical protein
MGITTRSRRGAQRLVRGLQVSNRAAHALARAGVNAARADPDTTPPQATAAALRDAGDHVADTVASVRRVIGGDGVGLPERAGNEKPTETAILDVMGRSDLPPGPLRAAVRALNTLDRALAEVTTRV